MSTTQDAHLAHIKSYDELLKVIKESTTYIANGRVDMARMYLAQSRYVGAQMKYKALVMGRDVTIWY